MDSNLDKFQTQWLHTDTSNQAADSKWIDIISCRAPFAAQHFKAALELMLNEPNITSSQILRAEIISDTSTQQGNRCLVRNLVPKQPEKDVVVVQRVLLSPIQTHGSQTSMHTEYQALSQYSLDSATPASPSQLPYFYPKVAKFKYSYIGDSCLETGHVVISVLPFETMESLAVDPRYLRIWERLVKFIHRFGRGMRDGYQKRVHHDQVVDKKTYQDLYYILKNKYKEWVLKWPEETDPSKHVFEDIGIATWLILLWKSTGEKNVRFVDVGCGNGFLTYLLTAEGYNGYGIDMSKRKIWNLFGDCDLQERPIIPNKEVFDCNWVIGNHPDELTLWIPIMALRSNASFVIIPCCFHELSYFLLKQWCAIYRTQSRYWAIHDLCATRGSVLQKCWIRHPTGAFADPVHQEHLYHWPGR